VRICHVSPHLPPDLAANALLPAELGRWRAERGDRVSFVTTPPAQGGTADVALPGPVERVAPRSGSALRRVLRIDLVSRSRSIAAALDRVAGDADLLHLHSNGLIVEVAARWAERHGKPYVLTLYGTEIWHYRRRRLFDPFTRAYERARAVTFYSRQLLERARQVGLDRQDLSVIYPPVSTVFSRVGDDTRQAWKRELGIAEPRVILNVKRLHPLAAQRDLIAAFAALARERHDVRLVICGTGALASELTAQTTALGIADRVTFTGLVTNAEVARFAAIADVFALPSRLEALPTVAVEALAAGTPVVSADHPGGVELAGIFGSDVTVVPRGDVPALARALAEAVAAPRRTSVTTAELVTRHFGRDAIEQAYEAVYKRAIL
jgi:glycosyltransferase involved in cell wall biosynthesis